MHTLCMYICVCICILTKCNSNQPFDSVSLSCILLPCYIRDGATCIEYHTYYWGYHTYYWGLLAKLGETSATAILANRYVTNVDRW